MAYIPALSVSPQVIIVASTFLGEAIQDLTADDMHKVDVGLTTVLACSVCCLAHNQLEIVVLVTPRGRTDLTVIT